MTYDALNGDSCATCDRKDSECEQFFGKKNTYGLENIPLILPKKGQKIVLITESPYKFPRGDCQTVDCFIEKDLEGSINELKQNMTGFDQYSVPKNIFDFIFKTFYPFFDGISVEKGVDAFLNSVYWTHACKKSVYNLNKWKGSTLCYPSLYHEIEEMKPNLVISATSLVTNRLKPERSVKAFNAQMAELIKTKQFVISDYSITWPRPDIEQNVEIRGNDISTPVLIMPNPSPQNAYKWSSYRKNEEAMKREIDIIRATVE